MTMINTVVWASAGTGKTRKLVEVYLELLEQGADPLRIVAVTFTEKAAAEMRDRIRSALYGKPGQWKTISLLPMAPISTIHGFCGMLLREHGIELGIDPSFVILDEQRSLDFAREAARETIRTGIRAGNEETERLFGDFGLEGLVETLVSAGYWLNSLGAGGDWLEQRAADQLHAAAELEKDLAGDIAKYGGTFEKIGELADEMDAKRARHPLRKRDDPRALLPQIGQIAGATASTHLSRLVRLTAERFRAGKRSINAMDFDDLLLGVRDLLKNHERIRRHYQDRFQALLVDEFQDTDEVQAEIISLLAGDPSQPSRFAPGKLMFVGDPKQSIYRFRRARVTVFFRMLQKVLDEGGQIEHLQDNHRSAPPIAEFANHLCRLMMDGNGKPGAAIDTQADLSYRVKFSDADLLKPKSDAPFLGITYVAAETGARATQGREMESEAIARLLKEWKSSGRIQSWKEVGVLLRAMTNIGIYLDAFATHRIPVYVVQGPAFYQKSEVSDLIAFLELVLHPDDALLRATVLTSSLFGVTFKELLQRGLHPPLFDDLLTQWSGKRDTATAAEILQDVIRKTSFDAVMMAQKNGPQRVANIGKLIEVTRDLNRRGTTGLDEVVRYLRERARDHSVRESEAQIVSQDDDVVRVLTVHQAKGLEFDIVIVPDLAGKTGRGSGDRTFFSDRWGLLVGPAYGLHRKPLPHSLILEAKDHEEDQQYEEEKRLLYVAITRARRMLVLGEGFSRQTGPWLQWIEQLFEKTQAGAIDKARDGKTQTVKFKGCTVKVLPASQLNLPEQLEFMANSILVGEPDLPRPSLPLLPPPVEITPSDLTALSGCFRYFNWTRMLGLVEPGENLAGGVTFMSLGSIAHQIMETEMTPRQDVLEASGVPDLGRVFKSPEWRELSSALPEKELPFIMHIHAGDRDFWIRGRMDAVVIADTPRVIDYKYAPWRDGAESSYEWQMTAYALAVMKAARADRAIGELWYLKAPMRIVKREYQREDSERKLGELLLNYSRAVETGEWPGADRAYCDRTECGFRDRCWTGPSPAASPAPRPLPVGEA